jgi:predicted permease
MQLDKLNFLVLFPALIFYSAASRQSSLDDLVSIGGGALGIIFLGCLFVLPLRKLQKGPKSFVDFAGVAQTAWRFNTAIAMVVIQALPEQSRSLMSIAIGFGVPLANILAVLVLSHGQSMPASSVFKSIMLNPFLLASVLGMLASMIEIPLVLDKTLFSLASTATPLALLSIGASINFKVLLKLELFGALVNFIKLMLLPACTLLISRMIGLSEEQSIILTLFAALPTATSAHLLANAFGANRHIVANNVAQSTVLACISLPIWMNFIIG